TVSTTNAHLMATGIQEFSGVGAPTGAVGAVGTGTTLDSGVGISCGSGSVLAGFLAQHGADQALNFTDGKTGQAQRNSLGGSAGTEEVRTGFSVLAAAASIRTTGQVSSSVTGDAAAICLPSTATPTAV